jgi:hypothetical protein
MKEISIPGAIYEYNEREWHMNSLTIKICSLNPSQFICLGMAVMGNRRKKNMMRKLSIHKSTKPRINLVTTRNRKATT